MYVIAGMGELGRAILEVLDGQFDVAGFDKEGPGPDLVGRADALQVCFPYFKGFEKKVREYAGEVLDEEGIIVIHSTVPIGTSDNLAAVHSPVRGMHPNLVESLRTFQKFFGGQFAREASAPFRHCGVSVTCTDNARTTEALKLWSTLQYGLAIMVEREIHEFCLRDKIDFDLVYEQANRTYNMGYKSLGLPEVQRPVIRHQAGPIGGHCVIANAHLLDHPLAHWLIDRNGEL